MKISQSVRRPLLRVKVVMKFWYVDVKILTNTGLKESMLHNKPP